MSRDHDQDLALITSADDLVSWFDSGSKGPDARLGVGTEHEKLGFDAETLQPLAYEGERGIGALLERLHDRYGYEATRDAGNIMALLRDGAAVTLEPGGQLELSGRVTANVHETEEELATHLREVREVASELGQIWTHLGLNHWDTPEQIPWMPKSRYAVMRRYLGTRGARAHWMMKTTCTVQANYDYRDERDALRKLALCSRLSPIVTALFATTPYAVGANRGAVSERMLVWEDVDPDRCGLPAPYLRPGAGFEDIVEWCLDIPMLFVVRDGGYRDVSGIPFRALLDGEVEGLRATIGDWELHLSAIFPDVRLKRYIEVRTADAGTPGHLLALPALWKGILYDDTAFDVAEGLVADGDDDAVRDASRSAARAGLDGQAYGRDLRALASALVDAARAGLERQGAEGEACESSFLEVLVDGDGRPVCAGRSLMEAWEACGGDRRAIIERFAIGR